MIPKKSKFLTNYAHIFLNLLILFSFLALILSMSAIRETSLKNLLEIQEFIYFKHAGIDGYADESQVNAPPSLNLTGDYHGEYLEDLLIQYNSLNKVEVSQSEEERAEEWQILYRIEREYGNIILQRDDVLQILMFFLIIAILIQSSSLFVSAFQVSQYHHEIIAKKKLLENIDSAREAERYKLASYLHDSLLQDLASVKSLLYKSGSVDKDIDDLLNTLVGKIRDTAYILAPLHLEAGLENALRELIMTHPLYDERILKEIKINLDGRIELRDELKLLVYRIVQEGLNNIRKHAFASEVSVFMIELGGKLILKIRDNGIGLKGKKLKEFEPGRKGGMGLPLMRSRVELAGGELTLCEVTEGGTLLRVSLPV